MAKKGEALDDEKLFALRRLRKARRYFKRHPLFAYSQMASEYEGYSYATFLDDLRLRSNPKKKKAKSTLQRYGRYDKMQWHLARYRETGEPEHGIAANRLRRLMTKPYRLQLRFDGEVKEYQLRATMHYSKVEQLSAAINKQCRSMQQAVKLVEEFLSSDGYGN